MPRRPDRWDDYCPMGRVIPGTQFLAFKVPLKEEFLHDLEEKDRFSPETLVQSLRERSLNLGGVIDLTFTLKYYNKQAFIKHCIDHEKIYVAGQVIPSNDVFRKFAGAVREYSKDGKLIGVHCTHGVNRTGYLICRYMIEEMNVDPQAAINLFNEARGHDLERENYLEDLLSRKNGQSSLLPSDYDSQFDWRSLPCDHHKDNSFKARKPRWRHNKDIHRDWRQNRNPSSGDRSAVSEAGHLGGPFHKSPEEGDFRHLVMGMGSREQMQIPGTGCEGQDARFNGHKIGHMGGPGNRKQRNRFPENGGQASWNSTTHFSNYRNSSGRYSHRNNATRNGFYNAQNWEGCNGKSYRGRSGWNNYESRNFKQHWQPDREFRRDARPSSSGPNNYRSGGVAHHQMQRGSGYQHRGHHRSHTRKPRQY